MRLFTAFSAALAGCLAIGGASESAAMDRPSPSSSGVTEEHSLERPSRASDDPLGFAVSDTLRATNGLFYIGQYTPWYSTDLLDRYPVRLRLGSEFDFFGDVQHGVELSYDRFHSGPFQIRGRYSYQGSAGGVSQIERYDGSYDADRDLGTFSGSMALTADFDSSFAARMSGRYTPLEGIVRPFRFDGLTVFDSGNILGNLDFGSGGLLDSDVDLRFGDGLGHVLGVFAGEQPSGLDTVVFSGAFAAQTGYVAPPPEPPDPPPPATPEIAATLDCSAANVCRGDNVDADDVRRAWNVPDTVESALRLREVNVDDRDGRQVEGLARRLGRYTPPLQSMARGNTQYYRGEDGFQYHFGRSGGAGSLDIELDFSGAGDGLSAEAKASMRRAAKLWSWTLADDGRSWYWSPSRDGRITLGDSVVSVERPAGRETGVVIAVAEPTRSLSADRESTIGAARPESAYSTSTTFRTKSGVVWLSSRLTDLVGSGTPGATAGIISVTAHEIGHVLGHADGIRAFDRHVFGNSFRGPNAMDANFGNPVELQDDGAHVDSCFSIMGYCHELGLEKVVSVYRPSRVDVALLTDLGYERFDAVPSTDRIDDADDFEGYSWSAWGEWAAWGVSVWRTLAFDVAGELEVTDELAAQADYFGLVTHEPLTARRDASSVSTDLRWEGSTLGVDVSDNRMLAVTGDAALDVTLTATAVSGTATLDRLVRHENGATPDFREPSLSYPLEIDAEANTFVATRRNSYDLRGGFYGPAHDEMAGIVNDEEAELLASFGGRSVDPSTASRPEGHTMPATGAEPILERTGSARATGTTTYAEANVGGRFPGSFAGTRALHSFEEWGLWAKQGEETLFKAFVEDDDSLFSTDDYAIMVAGSPTGSNPVSGPAVWTGAVLAYDAHPDTYGTPVTGEARLEVDLSAATIDVAFSNFTESHGDMSWSDLSLRGGAFSSRSGDSTISGAFYGAGHEGVAGEFSRDRLDGVFGALRR